MPRKRKPIDWSQEPDVMTIPQVARLLGFNACKLYEWARTGQFPCRRLGRSVWVPKGLLLEWLGVQGNITQGGDINGDTQSVASA